MGEGDTLPVKKNLSQSKLSGQKEKKTEIKKVKQETVEPEKVENEVENKEEIDE